MDMASNGPEIKNVSFREIVNMPSTTYATFGIYRYPAKFIPQVISYIFDKYSQPGMSVFDPFAGSGTVGIVAKLHGNSYELWDLNPMLKTLHAVATMEPVENINLGQIWSKMVSSKERFIPDWSNLEYWYPKEFLPFLYKVWGYYHSLREGPNKLLLTILSINVASCFHPKCVKCSINIVSNGIDWPLTLARPTKINIYLEISPCNLVNVFNTPQKYLS